MLHCESPVHGLLLTGAAPDAQGSQLPTVLPAGTWHCSPSRQFALLVHPEGQERFALSQYVPGLHCPVLAVHCVSPVLPLLQAAVPLSPELEPVAPLLVVDDEHPGHVTSAIDTTTA